MSFLTSTYGKCMTAVSTISLLYRIYLPQNIQHEYANSCNTMIEVLCLLTDINYDIKVVEQEGIGQGVLLGGRPSYLNDPEVFSWLNRTFVTVYSSD